MQKLFLLSSFALNSSIRFNFKKERRRPRPGEREALVDPESDIKGKKRKKERSRAQGGSAIT